MEYYKTKKGKNTFFVTLFNDYLDFVEYAENAEQSDRAIEESCRSSRARDTWNGFENWEQALDAAKNGWDVGLKKMAIDNRLEVAGQIDWRASVAGSVVNVPAFLQGQPDSMYEAYNTTKYDRPKKTLYIPVNALAGYSENDLIDYAKKVSQYINYLNSKYHLRVVTVVTNKIANGTNVILVPIKGFDNRFVLNTLAFAIHPAYWRRLTWAYMESTDYIRMGYGSSLKYPENAKAVKDGLGSLPVSTRDLVNFNDPDAIFLRGVMTFGWQHAKDAQEFAQHQAVTWDQV